MAQICEHCGAELNTQTRNSRCKKSKTGFHFWKNLEPPKIFDKEIPKYHEAEGIKEPEPEIEEVELSGFDVLNEKIKNNLHNLSEDFVEERHSNVDVEFQEFDEDKYYDGDDEEF